MKEQEVKVIKEAQVLSNQIFNVYGTPEEPLFLAKDVANLLEERDGYAVTRKVDDEEKLIHIICVGGQNRKVTMLTEDGLYEALMQSRKPMAKQFKKEIKHILKSIRKNGGYLSTAVDFSDPNNIQRLLDGWKKDRAKLLEQQPKVELHDKLMQSDVSISVGQFAKMINWGQNKLFSQLRKDKVFISQGRQKNNPYQKYMDLKYFEVIEKVINVREDKSIISQQTLITPKGQDWLTSRYYE